MRDWTDIMVHHSATVDSGTLSAAAIIKYHKEVRGWQDVGYHALVEYVSGSVVCMYGRPLTLAGAHCLGGWNSKALGICFIGDYSNAAPTKRMLSEAVKRIIRPWMRTFDISKSHIWAHRDKWDTACPGRYFDMQKLKGII